MTFRTTRYALALSTVLAFSACTGTIDYVPCEGDGRTGSIYYVDGAYQIATGEVYAQAGDRPFENCSILSGEIVLRGVIPHFEDFDPFVEIGGFFDSKYDAPDPPPGIGGGRIQGFPNLKRITKKLYSTSALLGDGPSDGGFYLDGFEQLEYVEGDFTCSGSDNLGTELRVVTGRVGCPQERLGKLEHAGEISYKGKPLPSLRTLGELTTTGGDFPARFEFPLLEEVGGEDSPYSGDFLLGGNNAVTLSLPNLKTVHGTLEIAGFLGANFVGVPAEERGAWLRAQLDIVEVHGHRSICRNGPNDPCWWEDTCIDVHGAGSPLCCADVWPICNGEE